MPATFLQICSAQKLEANTLEESALGSDTDLSILPVVPEIGPAVPFSLYKFGCEVVVFIFRDLKTSGHEMGLCFDYLTHGFVVGYSRGCPSEPWMLP